MLLSIAPIRIIIENHALVSTIVILNLKWDTVIVRQNTGLVVSNILIQAHVLHGLVYFHGHLLGWNITDQSGTWLNLILTFQI